MLMHINTIGGSHGKASADFINYQSVNPANFMFNQHSTIELNGKDKQTWYVDNTNGSVPVQSENISEKGDVRRSKNFKIYIPGHDNETTVNVLNNDLTNTPEGLLNPDILGNILAGSLPGQIFRLTGTGNEEIFTRKIGQKKYEIKDHLQSSIITVSDVKKPIDIESDGNFESAEAQIISYQEFYPGGQPMPGRTINNNTYRFGYNAGSEKDDEITGVTGSHFTTYFREFDTRTGRPWTPDPVFQAWQSPYTSMDNNPILYNDPLGNVITKFKDEKGNLLHETKDGSDATVTVANNKIDDFKNDVNKLDKGPLFNINTEKKTTIDLASKYMKEGQALWYNKDEQGNISNLGVGGANQYSVNQVGVRITGGIGSTFTMSGGIAWDSKGNVGLYGGVGGGVGGDGSIGLEFIGNTSYNSDFNIKDLSGLGGSTSGSAGIPLIGLDMSSGGNANSQNSLFTGTGNSYTSKGIGVSISPFLLGGSKAIENSGVIRLIKAKN